MTSRARSLSVLSTAVLLGAQCTLLGAPAATASPAGPAVVPVSAATDAPTPTAADDVRFAPSPAEGARHREVDVPGLRHRIDDVRTFTLAGLSWDADAADKVERVEMRLKEDGAWSSWETLDVDAMPEASATGRVGSTPLVTDGATGVEVRVSTVDGRPLPGARLALVHSDDAPVRTVEGTAAPAAAAPSTTTRSATASSSDVVRQTNPTASPAATSSDTTASADALRPTIIPRSAWGADESVTTSARTVIVPKALVLHHTASSNDYTRDQAAQQLRNIHRFHAVVLGWGDIGYSFIVTKHGDVFEGRRGSIDAAVQGFHAAGMNSESLGVSALGNYETAEAPAAMRTSITRVMTWLSARHGIDPDGTTTLTSSADSSWSSSRFHYGQQVTLPTVFGHITSSATGCPGRHLIAALPTIREQTAAALEQGRTPAPAPTPAPVAPVEAGPHVPRVAATTAAVRVRSVPVWRAPQLGMAAAETTVFPTGRQYRGWHQVAVPGGRTGWVSGQYLTEPRVVPEVAGLAAGTSLRTAPHTTAPVRGTLGASESVLLTGRAQAGWSEVAQGGRIGWVPTTALTGAQPFTHEASALRRTHLSAGPDQSYSGVATRRAGSRFALTGRVVGGWTEVALPGRTAWAPSTDLGPETPIG